MLFIILSLIACYIIAGVIKDSSLPRLWIPFPLFVFAMIQRFTIYLIPRLLCIPFLILSTIIFVWRIRRILISIIGISIAVVVFLYTRTTSLSEGIMLYIGYVVPLVMTVIAYLAFKRWKVGTGDSTDWESDWWD